MNELSLQGKIYVACQMIYFIMMSYGIWEVRKMRKNMEKNNG